MKAYGVIEALLKFFFPFREEMNLVTSVPSKNFDFSKFRSVHIHAYRYMEEKSSQYIILFNKEIQKEEDDFLDRKVSRERFKDLGREIQKIEYIYNGHKNLSSPPAPYLDEKWIFQWQGKKETFFFLIPTSFLRECISILGFGWMDELSEENLRENPESSLLSFERSVLYGKCQFFEDSIFYMQSLEKKLLSNLLTELMSRKLLSYNHIASLHLFYKDRINLLEFLPKETKNVVIKLSESIQPFLVSSIQGKNRWKRKMDYYLKNIISVYLFEQGTKNIMYDPTRLEDFYFYLNRSRVIMIDSITSVPMLIRSILDKGKVNELIRVEGTEYLIKYSGYGESLPLDELFRKFKPAFRSEFEYKTKEFKTKIKNMKEGKRQREQISLKIRLLHYLEDILLKKYEIGLLNSLSTIDVYDTIQNSDEDKMTFLYNLLGFEYMGFLFQGLKLKEDSPIAGDEADTFLMQKISLLPGIERELVEDIYYERLNGDRVINPEVIDRDFLEVSRRMAVLEEMRGFVRND